MGQKNSNQSDEGDTLSLTSNERLIIRNYRAMKRSVQLTFVDISEELAMALPAARPAAGPSPAQGC
ncbi:hypothetical protein [Herbaspirillum sp. SJZ107]|uniref:hypothetical protein n=1 Tax=Herbaspirillum sp. SJZ107 TaxID=2572881 RepID=UPI00163B4434|nr:hypothetical protein [Herbaspirillum sp. SJZ107]